MRPPHPLRLAIPLIAALLLTACAAEAEPEPKFDSPTSSASPTVEGDAPKEESVKQFLVRWAEAERDMQNTGETEAYRALTQDCESCEPFVERVEGIYSRGGTIRTDGTTITRVKKKNHQEVLAWATSTPTEFTESADGETKTLPGGEILYSIQVERRGVTWNMIGIVQVAQ